MAVDWNFYGNARMATYYTSTDLKDNGGKDTDLEWDLQSNSRIGANIKAENINARFEFGVKGSSGGDVDVGTRRVYGTWNFGSGKLKVGKDYTPVSQFISGQVYDGDLGLLGIGTQYGNRTGQIAFEFGGFEIALVTPNSEFLSGMTIKATVGVKVNPPLMTAAPGAVVVESFMPWIRPVLEATSAIWNLPKLSAIWPFREL
jgi:hypothetical protein